MTNALTLFALFQLAIPNTATAVVAYPTLGYTLSGTHLVRLAGVPGACYVVPDTATEYQSIQTASATRAALLYSATDAPHLIYRTPVNDVTVPLAEPAVATAISPAGSYFVMLGSSRLRLYRRSGVAALADIDTTLLPVAVSQITALAVGDYGDVVLNTATGFWYSANPATQGAVFSPVTIPVTFIRFAARDHLIVAYEPGQGRVIALHPTSAFAVEPLIAAQDSLTPVTGLEFNADATSLWITQANGTLLNYNLPQRLLTPYTIQPGAIVSVTAPGVYLWSAPNQPITILDTTRPAPTVLVVPAGPAEASK